MSNKVNNSERSDVSQRNNGNRNRTEKSKKLKPVHVVISLMAVLLIAATTVILVFVLKDKPEDEHDLDMYQVPGARGTLASPENIDEIRQQASAASSGDTSYIAKMNVDWVFDRWNIPTTNAYVENSIDNRRTVYFDLHLQETGELVYSSPFIPLGSIHGNFALDTAVPAGIHPAVVTYHLVDDNHVNITSVSVTVTLIILE